MAAHPDEEVLDILSAVIWGVKAHMHQALREDDDGITPMEMRALNYIAKHPGAAQVALVQDSGRDKAQITRTIKQLLERGLLRRTEDPADRRSHHLDLTDAGRAVHRKIQKHRKQLAARLVGDFDLQQREQVVALLQRMQRNLDDTP